MMSIRLRFGNLTILRNSLYVAGPFPHKDMPFNSIAMMTSSQVPHQEIWEIQVQSLSRKRTWIGIETSTSKCLPEPTAIGKSDYSYLPIHSSNQVALMDSLMATQIALNALPPNAGKSAIRVCLTARPSRMIHVDTTALRMEAGSKEFTLECIEISGQLRLFVNSWD